MIATMAPTDENPMTAHPHQPALHHTPRPDPGSIGAARIAWVLALSLLGSLIFTNWREGQSLKNQPSAVAASDQPRPPDFSDPFTLNSKVWVKFSHAMPVDPASKDIIKSQISQGVQNNTDRLRSVMITADLSGDDAGLAKLEEMKTAAAQERDATGALTTLPDWWTQDALRLEAVLASNETGSTENLNALKERHGWFAEVLATRKSPMTDPARQAAAGGGGQLILVLILAVAVFLTAIIGGITAGVFVLIGLAKRKFVPAFIPPLPGGSVYLETIAVFLTGFMVLKVVVPLILIASGTLNPNDPPPDWLTTATLAAQWLLLPLIFWPLCRGVTFARWRQDIGWHSGAGFWKEVWAGIYAYLGGLPLLALAALITVLIVVVRGIVATAAGEQLTPPSNPIVEILQSASPLALVMLFTLATIWAPIVEETLFRGGVFRHLRGRLGLLASAILSALWFGFMHSYEIPLLLPVITLGFVFALMREWRGSLIGCIIAHGLHNATVLTLAILFFSALG